MGKVYNCETGSYYYMVPYGKNIILYKGLNIEIYIVKIGNEINDEHIHSYLYNTEITLKIFDEKKTLEEYKEIVKQFIDEARVFYEENIMEIDNDS